MIEQVLIIGNEHTQEIVIRRQMQLREGEYFDAQIAEKDRQRILNLGLFHQVIIEPFKGEAGLIVCVMLTERWYIFPVPIIFINNKDWEKLSYGVGLKWENIWGRNVTATASIWFGFSRNVSVSYHDPWLFASKPIAFEATIFATRLPQSSVDRPDYEVVRNGAVVSLGTRWGFYSGLFLTLGYQQVSLPQHLPLTLSGGRVDHWPQIGMQFTYDQRDDHAYPLHGWYLYFSGMAFIEKSPLQFYKFKADLRRYQLLRRKLSLAGRVCLETSVGKIPIYEHLLFGQETRLRGHFTDLFEGENRMLASVELRVPFIPIAYRNMKGAAAYGHNLPFGVSAAVFMDTGSIWYQGAALPHLPFYTGYGFGLHIHLPYLELLRLERAWDSRGQGQYIIDLKTWF